MDWRMPERHGVDWAQKAILMTSQAVIDWRSAVPPAFSTRHAESLAKHGLWISIPAPACYRQRPVQRLRAYIAKAGYGSGAADSVDLEMHGRRDV